MNRSSIRTPRRRWRSASSCGISQCSCRHVPPSSTPRPHRYITACMGAILTPVSTPISTHRDNNKNNNEPAAGPQGQERHRYRWRQGESPAAGTQPCAMAKTPMSIRARWWPHSLSACTPLSAPATCLAGPYSDVLIPDQFSANETVVSMLCGHADRTRTSVPSSPTTWLSAAPMSRSTTTRRAPRMTRRRPSSSSRTLASRLSRCRQT